MKQKQAVVISFYETPTNLVDQNIRWVNVIVDMLIPQRATLFGWAVLFPLLYVLYRAVYEHCERYFIIAGIFATVTGRNCPRDLPGWFPDPDR